MVCLRGNRFVARIVPMNFVCLSPHFPSNYQDFWIELRRLGVNVLGLGDEPYDRLSPELKGALTEYYTADMHDYDQLLRALGYFTHRYGKIDRIDSHAEYWLETEAHLRTDFNIPGIQRDAIQNIKRKSYMKCFFQQAGVPVARGAVCRTLPEALKLAEEIGFPMVGKPDIGVGAAATFRFDSEVELEVFFNDPPSEDYIFEEFISGVIHTFDGLTDRDGNPCFFSSLVYDKGIMEVVRDDDHLYYYSTREIDPDLEETGRKVLKAFDVRERFFHFEFFRTHKDNRIVALEVNMRPPGGFTTDMFNYANDINIYKEWANVIVNNRFESKWTRPYHVIYISRKNRFHYRHSHQEVAEKYAHLLCRHEELPAIYARALGDYCFIARAPELETLMEMAEFAHQLETP